MPDLLGWLQGAAAQINPWDDGADYNSVMRKRREEEQRRQQPQPRPQPTSARYANQGPRVNSPTGQPQRPTFGESIERATAQRQPNNAIVNQTRNSVVNQTRPSLRIGDLSYTKNPDGTYTSSKGAKRTQQQIDAFQRQEQNYQNTRKQIVRGGVNPITVAQDTIGAVGKVASGAAKGGAGIVKGMVNDLGNRTADFGMNAAETVRELNGQNQKAYEEQQKYAQGYDKMAQQFIERARNARSQEEFTKYINAARGLLTSASDARDLANTDIQRGLQNTDVRTTISNAGMTALDLATLGKGKLLLEGVGLGAKVTPEALKQLGKNTLVTGVQGAGIGGAYGGLGTLPDPNATLGDYAKNIALGAALGGGIGVGAQVALPAVGAVTRSAINGSQTVAKEVAKTNPKVAANSHPAVLQLDDTYSTLQRQFDVASPAERRNIQRAMLENRVVRQREFKQVVAQKKRAGEGGFAQNPFSRPDIYKQLDNADSQLLQSEAAKYKDRGQLVDEITDSIWQNNKKGQGVDVAYRDTDYGNGGVEPFKTSNNPFYRAYFEATGKKPTKSGVKKMVNDFLDGEDNAVRYEIPPEVRGVGDVIAQRAEELDVTLATGNRRKAGQSDNQDSMANQSPELDQKQNLSQSETPTQPVQEARLQPEQKVLSTDQSVAVRTSATSPETAPLGRSNTQQMPVDKPTASSRQSEIVSQTASPAGTAIRTAQRTNTKQVDQQPVSSSDAPLVQSIPSKRDLVNESNRVIKSGETAKYKLKESFQKSENVPQELKDTIGAFGDERTTKSNKELWSSAQKRVYDDPAEAMRFFSDNANDESVATGYALINRYMKENKVKEAGEIAMAMADRAVEAGRQTQAFAIMKRLTPEGAVAYVDKKVARFTKQNPSKAGKLDYNDAVRKELYDMAKQVNDLPEGLERNVLVGSMSQRINNIFPSSVTDKAVTVWKAGLLTSLRTHERNLLGNSINLAGENIANYPAVVADKLASLATGKRTIAMRAGEGTFKGVREGLKNAKVQATTGIDPLGDSLKYSERHVTWGKSGFEQLLKKGTGLVFNTLGAEDKVFKGVAYNQSIENQAIVVAINRGLKGRALEDAVSEIKKNPTTKMKQVATDDADIATFNQENAVSTIAQNIKQSARRKSNTLGAAVDTVIPFTQVPGGVAVQMFNYSPLGGLRSMYQIAKAVKTKDFDLQRKASMGIGRGVTGSMLLVSGYYLANKGLLTGQPKDDAERAQWEAQGRQPNAVKVGDRWYALGSIGPQNLLMLAGGQFAKDQAENGTASAANNIGFGSLKNFQEQTFLQGIKNITDAIDDPQRYAGSWAESMATSVIPNIVKDVAKATDPNQRESVGLGDKFKKAIPGLSQTLPERRTTYGDVMKNKGVGNLLDLFNSTPERDIPEAKYIDTLRGITGAKDHVPSKADRSVQINGEMKKLTTKEFSEYQKYIGEKSKSFIGDAMSNKDFTSLPAQEQVDKIDKALKDINAAAKYELFGNRSSTGKLSTRVADVINSGKAKVDASLASSNVEISSKVSEPSKAVLNEYYSMDSKKRESWFAAKPDNEYKYNKAKYENDKANGEISKIDDITRRRALKKDEVGSKFTKDSRDLYSLSKANIYEYVSKVKDGQKLADQLMKYDRALYDAGLVKYMKFRTGLAPSTGRRSSGGRRKSGGRANGGATAGSSLTSLERKLMKSGGIKTAAAPSAKAATVPQMKKTALARYTAKQAKDKYGNIKVRTRKLQA